MDCSIPGFSVIHYLPELAQTHVRWVGDAIQPSHPLSPTFSFCLQSFPASGSFQMSWLFISGGRSTGDSASASVLPMNILDWSPLGWTGWISLQSKGLSRDFSNTTVQKHHFFSAQLSLWSKSHIYTWLLEKSIAVVQSLRHVWLFVTPWTHSTPGFPVLHYLPEFAEAHIHWVGDAI